VQRGATLSSSRWYWILPMSIMILSGCVSQPAFRSPVVSPMQSPSSLATPTVATTEILWPTPTRELNAVEAVWHLLRRYQFLAF
jgi:hypothetical protein